MVCLARQSRLSANTVSESAESSFGRLLGGEWPPAASGKVP